MRADAVHALGVRQVFVTRLAGNGKGHLAVELRNDRAEFEQGAYDIIGKFLGGQHRPAQRRQFLMTMAERNARLRRNNPLV
ncbi:hypothetical protein D3C76_1806330 [compost metagenome]